MRFLMAALGVAMLVAGPIAGPLQAETEPALTLERALAESSAASPALDAAASGRREAATGRIVAGLRPNPIASVDSENIVGSGDYRGIRQAETMVSLAVPLEIGGQRSARLAAADVALQRADLAGSATSADLRLALTQAFVAALSAQDLLAIAQDQLAVTAENLRVATRRSELGVAPPIDAERARLQHLNAQAERDQAQTAEMAARVQLGRLMGRPVTEPLDRRPLDHAGASGPLLGEQPGATADIAGNLAVAQADADIADAEAQIRLARSQRWQDVSVMAGARQFQASNDVALVVGISLPLPLFNNGNAAIARAGHARDQAEARRRQTMLDTQQAIDTALADRNRAAATLRLSEPLMRTAAEAARIARIGYAEGKFDQLALLDAETTLLQTRRSIVEARSQYLAADARITRLLTPALSENGY
ncbi:TolC family protein [Altererythrobacter xixiisoli]|uniref:TolC family protein n=1 Tax=Croceibacterium xixiisoli TaxID=1476466 RepID=A0A6I4TNP5_9SPHN|nr:TolC family protein [Croceibacterium xixiisoli]MXO97502.1 TolC family protein [Croceibacterium xixiisoli]